MPYVNIYGNFRDKYTNEWAGTGPLKSGKIECTANLGEDQEESDEIYEIIEAAIATGEKNGEIESSLCNYTWELIEG